ncbi:hypothetical protein [Halochromatium sp.]
MTKDAHPIDIRWQQRLSNYLRALSQLQEAVQLRTHARSRAWSSKD